MKGKREESDRNNREKVAGPLFTYLSFLFLSFFLSSVADLGLFERCYFVSRSQNCDCAQCFNGS